MFGVHKCVWTGSSNSRCKTCHSLGGTFQHYGIQYWQEVGRCARQIRNGSAHLLAHARSLVVHNNSSEDVVQLCKSSGECLRSQILRCLTVKGMKPFVEPSSSCDKNCEHIMQMLFVLPLWLCMQNLILSDLDVTCLMFE